MCVCCCAQLSMLSVRVIRSCACRVPESAHIRTDLSQPTANTAAQAKPQQDATVTPEKVGQRERRSQSERPAGKGKAAVKEKPADGSRSLKRTVGVSYANSGAQAKQHAGSKQAAKAAAMATLSATDRSRLQHMLASTQTCEPDSKGHDGAQGTDGVGKAAVVYDDI
jgi:hypothetical protein